MKTSLVAMVASLFLSLLVGCASPSADEADGESGADALKNGAVTTGHAEVGRVELTRANMLGDRAGEAQSWCAGTLITPTIVITARACTFKSLVANGGWFYIDQDTNGDGKVDVTHRYAIKDTDTMDRGYSSSERGRLHFVHLATPVPASVAVPAKLRKTPLADHERVIAVGYGASDKDGWGPKNTRTFNLHYITDILGGVMGGPYVMEGEGDRACGLFDAHGELAAVGVSQGYDGWLSHAPDYFVDVGTYADRIASLVKEMETGK